MEILTACILSFLLIESGTAHMTAQQVTYNEHSERAMMLAAIDSGRFISRTYGARDVDSGFICEGGGWINLGLNEKTGTMIASYVGIDDTERHVELHLEEKKSVN